MRRPTVSFPIASALNFETKMKLAQAYLNLGSACVPHALVNVSFASRKARPDTQFDSGARTTNVRRGTRRTAPETGALPET
jgi:hypothetical protein